MQVSLNTMGNVMHVDSNLGRYSAFAPAAPEEDGKIKVKTPSGEIVKMTQSEWIKLIACTSRENGLVRQPKNDCFTHKTV